MKLSILKPGAISAILLIVPCSTQALRLQAAPTEPVPPMDRVMIVVLENTNYKNAHYQPFLQRLNSLGTSFTRYSGVTHPSQPNYIALISGAKHQVITDLKYDIDARTIVDLLEEKGKTWKGYMDAYPGNCFKGSRAATYARKHNPFISFKNIQNNPARCARVVNASELHRDIENGTLPNFSFYSPDMNNDGHDTSIEYAAKWLETTFGPKLENPKFMKGMTFILTFDESSTYLGNHIYTTIVSENVKADSWSNGAYNHYNLLRTIEDGLGLENLGQYDATAAPISGIWKK